MGSVLGAVGCHLRIVFRRPAYRRIAVVSALAYLAVYLYSIRHFVYLRGIASQPGSFPAFQVVPDWPTKLWKVVAPYAYEPVAALYVPPGFAIFLAPANLLLGGLLGLLAGMNVALAVEQFRRQQSCRRPTVSGFLGALPSLFTGFTCCVPTVALVLGANSILALIALRAYLVPASLLALVAGVLWGAWRGAQGHAGRPRGAFVSGIRPDPSVG